MRGPFTPSAVSQSLKPFKFEKEFEWIDRVRDRQSEIDRLVVSYVMQAFASCGLLPEELSRFSDTEFCRRQLANKDLPVSKLWWLQMLAKIAAERQFQHEDPGALLDRLRGSLPFYEIELDIIERVGQDLVRLMMTEGTTATIQILFADDLMTRWYSQSVTYSVFNGLGREATRVLQRHAGRELAQVLEVGAGTGGLTRHILDLFDPATTRYRFTDLGGFFLRSARNRFADFPFVDFSMLDLERPLTEQGIEERSIDLVIANNVIHDTRNLRFTLENLVSVMRPAGMMLMLELTDPQIWWHMCFGSLDGWWRFKADPADERDALMLLEGHQWIKILADCGFRETVALSDQFRVGFANELFLSQVEGG